MGMRLLSHDNQNRFRIIYYKKFFQKSRGRNPSHK